LTTVCWGSPTLRWTSGAEAFVRHYKDKLCTYEESKGGGKFLPEVKLVMLQNAVSTHPDLVGVQHMDKLLRTRTGDSLDLDKYFDLLISTAAHYDETSPSSSGKIKGCSVYTHELYPEDVAPNDNGPYSTIDSPIDLIQVFQHDSAASSRGRNPRGRRRPPSTHMHFAAWKQLTPEQQVLWDQLPNKAKEIILAGTKSRNASDGCKANLHDMSAQDYLESQLKVNLTDILAHEFVVNLHNMTSASMDMDPQFFDAQEDDPQSKDSDDSGS